MSISDSASKPSEDGRRTRRRSPPAAPSPATSREPRRALPDQSTGLTSANCSLISLKPSQNRRSRRWMRRRRRRHRSPQPSTTRRPPSPPHNAPCRPMPPRTFEARAVPPTCGAPRRGRRPSATCGRARTSRPAAASSDTPSAPWAWIARSMTRRATSGAATLIAEISMRAPLLPAVSISHAVLSTSSRTCSISMRLSAIHCWITPCSASGLPNAVRSRTRRHISSSARSATPMARMQWWMRPGPSRACAMAKPPPSSPSRWSTGTRTSSKTSSQWPSLSW